MWKKLLNLSLTSLLLNKVRTFLTVLGVVIGTMTVVVVLSVGDGLKAFILDQVASYSPNSLFIEAQFPTEGNTLASREKEANRNTNNDSGIFADQITSLKLKDLEDIKKIPYITSGYAQAIFQEKITFGNVSTTPMSFLVQEDYFKSMNIKLREGRVFTSREEDSLQRMVVLGSELKKNLFGEHRPALGENIKIKNINFKVTGVMEPQGSSGIISYDEGAYLPVKTGQKLLLGWAHVPIIVVEVDEQKNIGKAFWETQRILRRNHNIKDPKKDDFRIVTMDEAVELVETIIGGINLLLFSLAAISLLVGGIGIMNVMYVTVTERTREIGLRKAVGAKPKFILLQFLLESILVTIIGGALGILVGIGISWVVSFTAIKLGFMLPFVISQTGIEISLVVSITIGVIFGYAPAKKASSLNPIRALQDE